MGHHIVVWRWNGHSQGLSGDWFGKLSWRTNDIFWRLASFCIVVAGHYLRKFFNGSYIQFGHHGHDAPCSCPISFNAGYKPIFIDGGMHHCSFLRIYASCCYATKCGSFWVWVLAYSGYGPNRIFNEPVIHCNYGTRGFLYLAKLVGALRDLKTRSIVFNTSLMFLLKVFFIGFKSMAFGYRYNIKISIEGILLS